MIDEAVLIENIEKRIETRRAMAAYFDEKYTSFSVIYELRDLIRFINKQKNNEQKNNKDNG